MNSCVEILVGWGLLTASLFAQVSTSGTVKSGYAPVDGLKLYYEIHSSQQGHGGGVPLILLHGGIMSTDSWTAEMPVLSASREVIALDRQAHGRTAELMKQSPLYQTYARVAPRPQDWEVLLTKLHELLSKDYNCSSEVRGIKAPALLVFGDADAIRPEHAVEFFELLGGGKKDAAGMDRECRILGWLSCLEQPTTTSPHLRCYQRWQQSFWMPRCRQRSEKELVDPDGCGSTYR